MVKGSEGEGMRKRRRRSHGFTLLRLSNRRVYSSRISCSRGVKRGDVDLDGLLGLLVAIVRIVEVGVQSGCKFTGWMCMRNEELLLLMLSSYIT